MKRFLLIILLLSLAAAAGAQEGLPTTVKEVRQKYADAQQYIALMDQEEHIRSQVTLSLQRNVPAIGIQKKTVTCFFENFENDKEGEWGFIYRPFFMTVKFNAAVRQFYREFLYDAASGKPVFVFLQQDSIRGDQKDETRYYFGPSGLISENIKGERVMDQQEAYDMAISLWSTLFNNMNNL